MLKTLGVARPRSFTDEQIIEAAREVFFRDGLTASTREISRRAGVSQGLIYQRFPSKEALFVATMTLPLLEGWQAQLDELVGQGDLRQNLKVLSCRLVHYFRVSLARLMMRWSVGEQLGASPSWANWMTPQDAQALEHYLRDEMRLGRLHPHDPEALVASLTLPLVAFCTGELTSRQQQSVQAVDQFLDQTLTTLWFGIAPRSS